MASSVLMVLSYVVRGDMGFTDVQQSLLGSANLSLPYITEGHDPSRGMTSMGILSTTEAINLGLQLPCRGRISFPYAKHAVSFTPNTRAILISRLSFAPFSWTSGPFSGPRPY